jgi:hypothetical protein
MRTALASGCELMTAAFRSRISRICCRASGTAFRRRSPRPSAPWGASPSSWRIRLISPSPTPFFDSALTNACLMASTSSRSIFSLFENNHVSTWLFIFPSLFSPASFTSPAFYLPDAISWNS